MYRTEVKAMFDTIPSTAEIRKLLSECVRDAALLRTLLRIAEDAERRLAHRYAETSPHQQTGNARSAPLGENDAESSGSRVDVQMFVRRPTTAADASA